MCSPEKFSDSGMRVNHAVSHFGNNLHQVFARFTNIVPSQVLKNELVGARKQKELVDFFKLRVFPLSLSPINLANVTDGVT